MVVASGKQALVAERKVVGMEILAVGVAAVATVVVGVGVVLRWAASLHAQ